MHSAFYYAGGNRPQKVLRAITGNPAKICGVASHIGSIDPCKDAGLVLFRDDPLSLTVKPEAVVIGGRVLFQNQERREQQICR